jgi:hypothetical protein
MGEVVNDVVMIPLRGTPGRLILAGVPWVTSQARLSGTTETLVGGDPGVPMSLKPSIDV